MNIKLTKEQQQYVAGGVIGLGALVYFYVQFFWLPMSKETAEVQTKIKATTDKINKAKGDAAKLPELERDLVRLNEDKVKAEARLPKTKSVPDILVTLGQLGSRYNVAVTNFSPGSSKPQQYFFELHFPVTVQGAFHNIGKFLAALALEQRIYNVFNVNYAEPTADTGEMNVTFELVSYQYKEG